MSFEKLVGAAIALYVLLNFLLLPRITKAWKANRRFNKIGKAGLLSALQFIRDLALIASVMYVAFALLTLALGFGFGANAAILGLAVSWADRAYGSLKAVKDVVDSYFFLIPLALIVYVTWRRQRDEFTVRFERLVEDEYDRLNTERARGAEWGGLEPDEQMKAIDRQIESLEQEVGKLTPANRERRQYLRREIVKLKEKRNEADYERRVSLDALNSAVDDTAHAHGWRRFLLSKGFFSDLKGATKLLSRVTLAFLSVALVGVAGNAGLTPQLWKQILTLDDLRVEATKAKVANKWKDPARAGKQETLSEDDRQAVSQLADTFARAIVQNRNWRPLQVSVRATAELQRQLARRAILEHVELPAADGRAAPAFADDLTAAHRELLNDVAHDGTPESRVGRIVADREGPAVKSFFGEKWGSVKAAVLDHAKLYREPVKMSDLEGSLVDRIVSAAFDGVVPQAGESEIVKQARSAMSSATKKAVSEAVTTEFHKVMEDLAAGEPYAERMAKVKTEDIPVPKARAEEIAALIHERKLPDNADFQRKMSADAGAWRPPEGPSGPEFQARAAEKEPPGGGGAGGGDYFSKAYNPTGPQTDEVVRDVARRATHEGQYSLPEESIDALAQYEDHFPRSIASESRTPLAQALQRFRVAEDVPRFNQLASLKVARASNFGMLRGFSRVGGVLIGEDPINPKDKIDIRTFAWRVAGRNFTLTLGDAAGRVQEFGPYDRSLIHQALGYAADGRPVAVTMTKARPLPQLKIHLNPALVDTPLGCRVSQLDRLVDIFAGEQLPARTATTEKYVEQFAVYNLVWALRLKALAGGVGEQGASFERESQVVMEANRDAALQGLHQPGLFDDSSVFRRKPEFFDPSIVKAAKSCRKNDGPAFEVCALEEFSSARALKNHDVSVLRLWLEGQATFMPWSGVRERKFKITSDLAFLRQPTGGGIEQRLWPFDFIVQIAFTSPAVNLPEKEQERYADTRPIEFADLQPKIEELVAAGIDQSGFHSAFEDLRAFAVLQRLFRAALRGNLGDNFPLERLAALTSATAGGIPFFHTERWNGGSYTAHIQAQMQQAALTNPSQPGSQPWVRAAAERAGKCSQAIAQALETGTIVADVCDLSAFGARAESACKAAGPKSEACFWQRLTKTAAAVPQVVKMEASFGVLADQRAGTQGPGCPPLTPVFSSQFLR